MVDRIASEPYTPNLVPQASLEADPRAQLRDLERFLSEELERIQTAMLFVPVQAAYGSLFVNNGVVNQPLGLIPQLIESFNETAPANPNRVLAALSPDQLIVREGGVYLLQSFTTAAIEAGAEYHLEITIDGIASGIIGGVDASNQTDVVNIAMFGMRELNAGADIRLEGEATAATPDPHDFTVLSAVLAVFRISELHGRDASAIP